MAQSGESWENMVALECHVCTWERERKNRVAAPKDERMRREPFLEAPYIHRNNDPKYHALLVRAMEKAKHAEGMPKHVLWFVARDSPQDAPEFRIPKDQMD